MRLKVRCRAAEKCGDAIAVRLACNADASSIQGGRLLRAAGHRPNTDDYALDMADVNTDAKGFISVHDQWGFGSWAMYMAAAHSLTPPTMILKLSRPMSLMTSHVAYPVAFLPTACSRAYLWAWWGMTEHGVRATGISSPCQAHDDEGDACANAARLGSS